jgi:hypothetical protein
VQLVVPVALHAVLVLAARHAVLVAVAQNSVLVTVAQNSVLVTVAQNSVLVTVAQNVMLAIEIVTMDVAVKRNPRGKTGSVPSKMMDSKTGVAFNLASLSSL